MGIIGISCYYHDSAAALISEDGEILAAVQEERFSRKKFDSRFPFCSVDYCLKIAKENNIEVEKYIYYEKPIRVFMRLLETYFSTAPRGLTSFIPAMETWIGEKIFTKQNLVDEILLIDEKFTEDKLFFSEHHLSHAASAFYPSPFNESIVLCLDAVGEWATTTAWHGKGKDLKPLWEINFPHSIGMLYSSFTYYCGFKVNSGEYKLMGLAPYGEPIYKDKILNNLITVFSDGSYELNMKYFKYHRGLRMISSQFINLFGEKPRLSNEPLNKFYMDIASSIQKVTEELILNITDKLYEKYKINNLCMAGGVALNCVANGKILDQGKFKNIWIQPAAGDAGGALGSALALLSKSKNFKRNNVKIDKMHSSYLGPEFSDEKIEKFLLGLNISYEKYQDDELFKEVAQYLSDSKVVGWFQGRMEYGPRALGNRSILGDPRVPDMQKKMNIKIKNRESFRPFAPAILDSHKKELFGIEHSSPYMLITRNLSKKYLIDSDPKDNRYGIDKVNQIRSIYPGITHLDNSCRVQTVSESRNKKFFKLISEFNKLTGCPVLINTSFNVRGEPIVCTPEDALRCFINTSMDILVLGSFIILKDKLPSNLNSKFLNTQFVED
ncbi:Carbamoyltransferase [Prochlorococcus marinus subsp. pastoris str. CCMP1986]|uniref:Carbamoyltransferase n=1 Tax=Prochlorococcus marinus subsp. pastoris (strain CCMP1986 / NIES-2087 / MED4) TaxID=59919 RepID=Q7V0L0_PROMP|nr:carbamoyltransferase [Prochlorococcus marinus]KGF87191.1 Nodulation protein nolO [Prochlorococcus marinus str. EQPAC1]CAE19705.1 Carbamoyltransferase [Prochlorococcus marinus subsp. pastoris str. CCMP1986]